MAGLAEIAFYCSQERCIQVLEIEENSITSWKRKGRRRLCDDGVMSPRDELMAHKVDQGESKLT